MIGLWQVCVIVCTLYPAIAYLSEDEDVLWNKWNAKYGDDMRMLKQQVQELQNQLNQLRETKEINKNIDKTEEERRPTRLLVGSNGVTHVAFYAHLSQHSNASHGMPLIYDSVSTNIGHGYNKFSGIFRAPVAGTYHFTASVMTKDSLEKHTEIVHNGNAIGWVYSASGGWESGSASVIITLEADDSVWIRDADGGLKFLHYNYNSFSGFLLYS